MKILVLGASLGLFSNSALACGGKASSGNPDAATTEAHATACAKKASLVGANCSYTTGMMAQRVVAEGEPWSFTGTLQASDNALPSHVAAPYTVGPQGAVNVIGNELVERISDAGLAASRLTLQGRLLDIDGVRYFVLTSYSALAS